MDEPSAETLELKNGRTVEATILSFSDDSIKIETAGETRTIPNADISKINGRSLTADLTVIGMENKPMEKKQTFGNIFSRIQKKSDDKNK